MDIIITPAVLQKLRTKHNVKKEEVKECFYNREFNFLEDTREKNKTNPPTQWFIAETDLGRKLKVCFMVIEGRIVLKSAFQANDQNAIDIYYRKAK